MKPSLPAFSLLGLTLSKLKPTCVQLSETALKFPSADAARHDLVNALQRLLKALERIDTSGVERAELDAKLAEYIFFPLSHVLRKRQRVPAVALELTVNCLNVLLQTGWKIRLPADLGIQLLVLSTFLAARKADNNEMQATTEKLRQLALRSIAHIFNSVESSQGERETLFCIENVPALGHAVTVILDNLTDSESHEPRQDALSALQSFVKCAKDREILASFFPGIVSSLAKVLTPSTRARQPWTLLRASLNLAQTLLERVVSDEVLDQVIRHEQGPQARHTLVPRLDEPWLKNTAPHVKVAVSAISRLCSHERLEVRHALQSLCFSILQDCFRSLPDSHVVVIECLSVIDQKEGQDSIERKLVELERYNPAIVELEKSCLYDQVQRLPRILSSNDEHLKVLVSGQIALLFRVLRQADADLFILDQNLTSVLQDALSALAESRKGVNQVAEEESPSSLLDRTDGTVGTRSRETLQFPMLFGSDRGENATYRLIERLSAEASRSSGSVAMAQSALDSARSLSTSQAVANTWLALHILKLRFDQTTDLEAFVHTDDLHVQENEVREELYSFAVANLGETETSEGPDWRLQALSMEIITFRAQCLGGEFRPELAEVLYPILNNLGGANHDLRQHAILCLNLVASSCGYQHAQDLVVSNADYLVNGVGVRLNVFDVSPQAPQVLSMLVTMVGPRLLPYLDDVSNGIFDALECFHGYPKLVESLFRPLRAIVREGIKAQALTIDGRRAKSHLKHRAEPSSIKQVEGIFRERARRKRMRDKKKLDEESGQLPSEIPQRPWGDLRRSRQDEEAARTQDQESSAISQPPTGAADPDSPPVTSTYRMIRRITVLTQHHLPSSEPSIRASLLSLLAQSLPYLSAHEDDYLPLIHTLWPVLVPRLQDREAYVVAALLQVMSGMCQGAGDFMSTRIEGIWPTIQKLYGDAHASVQRPDRGPVSRQTRPRAMMPRREGPGQVRNGPAARARVTKDEIANIVGSGLSHGSRSPAANDVPRTAISTVASGRGGEEVVSPIAYMPTTSRMIIDALTDFLLQLVSHVRVPHRIMDEVVQVMLRGPLVEDGRADVREVLEGRNADAVWLCSEKARWEARLHANGGQDALRTLRANWETLRPHPVDRAPDYAEANFVVQ